MSAKLLAARSAWRAPARKHQRTWSALMSRFVLPSMSVVRLATAAVVLAVACQTANAQVKPFKVRGGGPAPEGLSPFGADSPHSATGQATHLGRYSGNGVANVLLVRPLHGAARSTGPTRSWRRTETGWPSPMATPTTGPSRWASSSGRHRRGQSLTVFVAEFNPIPAPAPGGFKDVIDGSFIMVATTEPFDLELDEDGFTPPFDYTWEGEGWIEFRKR